MKTHYWIVAQARAGLQPLADRDACADLWSRLMSRFPRITACVLMPDQTQLLLETGDPELAKLRLATELRAFTRRHFPGQRIWNPVAAPRPVDADAPLELELAVRAIHHGPCESHLIADPLEWEWSTYRDAQGAAFPSWIPGSSRALGDGALTPETSARTDTRPLTPDTIACAAIQATRAKTGDLQRRSQARLLAVHLFRHLGLGDRHGLASNLGITLRSLQRAEKKTVPDQALRAALRILSDQRLC